MANIYLTTDNKQLLQKISDIVDHAEHYDTLRLQPGYVTQRYADIDTHPDGGQFAYPNDGIVAKYLSVIGDELSKYGVPKETATKAMQDTQTGAKESDSLALTSGAYAGVTIALEEKAEDWTPVDKAGDGKADADSLGAQAKA